MFISAFTQCLSLWQTQILQAFTKECMLKLLVCLFEVHTSYLKSHGLVMGSRHNKLCCSNRSCWYKLYEGLDLQVSWSILLTAFVKFIDFMVVNVILKTLPWQTKWTSPMKLKMIKIFIDNFCDMFFNLIFGSLLFAFHFSVLNFRIWLSYYSYWYSSISNIY